MVWKFVGIVGAGREMPVQNLAALGDGGLEPLGGSSGLHLGGQGGDGVAPDALVHLGVDAFVVRLALMPALMHLFGDAAWWLPKWLDRIMPNVDVEGSALERSHGFEHEDDHEGADTAAEQPAPSGRHAAH